MSTKEIPCIGCGALVPDIDHPTHAYIGASPGCWKLYGDVLAKEYSDERYYQIHRLTVDAYAAQHPGTPSRRSMQSVNIHLVSLYMMLEQNLAIHKAAAHTQKLLAIKDQFKWLEPPVTPNGVPCRTLPMPAILKRIFQK